MSETKRNTGFLGNALHMVKKSVDLAKRHIEEQKRHGGERILRAVADKIKQAAEESQRKRNLEVATEFYKKALEKRDEDAKAVLREAAEKIKRAVENAQKAAEKKKRDEDNKMLREVTEKLRRAVDNHEKAKRNTGGFLNNALNMLQRSADIVKRGLDEDEDTAAYRAVSENVKKAVDQKNEKRENVGFLGNAMNILKKSADMAKRHIEASKRNEAQERVLREVAERMKREHEKQEQRKQVLRDLVDKVKKAADAFQQRRDQQSKRTETIRTEEAVKRNSNFLEGIKNAFNLVARRDAGLEKRYAALAINRAAQAAKEKRKREEETNWYARELPTAKKSTFEKKSPSLDEKWKREVRGVLDNKIAQIHATKRFLERPDLVKYKIYFTFLSRNLCQVYLYYLLVW